MTKYIHSPAIDECKAGPKWLVKLKFDNKNIVLALTSYEAKDHNQAIHVAKIRAEMARKEAPIVSAAWGSLIGTEWGYDTPDNRKAFGVEGYWANDNIVIDGVSLGRIVDN